MNKRKLEIKLKNKISTIRELKRKMCKKIEDYLNSIELEKILLLYNVEIKNAAMGKAYKKWKVIGKKANYCYMNNKKYYLLQIDIKELKEVI